MGLSPNSATAGDSAFTLTVNGSDFVSDSVVRWNGADRVTTYVSSTQLTAAIPATDIAPAGTDRKTVVKGTRVGRSARPHSKNNNTACPYGSVFRKNPNPFATKHFMIYPFQYEPRYTNHPRLTQV